MEGIRKGAWSKVEDELLKGCVRQYGEGTWHLVPIRAGLNRCRKSCRLRWLNYLKPTIKRGEFSEDEVDMMKRLHRLLGNRWTLIAGRLSGRTPNDVKNYWNTHIHKKVSSSHKEKYRNAKKKEIIKPNLVIKPQPRNFSSTNSAMLKMRFFNEDQSGPKQYHNEAACDNNIADGKWWEGMIDDKRNNPKENDGYGMLDFNVDQFMANGIMEDQSLSDFFTDIHFLDF